MQAERNSTVSALSRASPGAHGRWRHPFDSAAGTLALGVLLTLLLVMALRLLNG